ncbi:MAG: hypothetical protein ABIH04_02155 [Planctomycetota bacterium]
MKNLLIILAVLIPCLLLIASCGSGEENKDRTRTAAKAVPAKALVLTQKWRKPPAP